MVEMPAFRDHLPAANEHVVESAPTPYSTSHAIVQSRPGEPEEQPPTF